MIAPLPTARERADIAVLAEAILAVDHSTCQSADEIERIVTERASLQGLPIQHLIDFLWLQWEEETFEYSDPEIGVEKRATFWLRRVDRIRAATADTKGIRVDWVDRKRIERDMLDKKRDNT